MKNGLYLILVVLMTSFSGLSQSRNLKEMHASKWVDDLDFLTERVESTLAFLPDLNRKIFFDQAAILRNKFKDLDNMQSTIEIAKLMAMLINDGHTELQLLQQALPFDRLPLVLYYFDNELRIIMSGPDYSSLLGRQIVADTIR